MRGLILSPIQGQADHTGHRAVFEGSAGRVDPAHAVLPSDPSSPARLVQRQAIDAPLSAQDVERPATGQNLQVPHRPGKLVHRLDVGEAEHGTGCFQTRSSNAPRRPLGTARGPASPPAPSPNRPPGPGTRDPAPRRSRSAAGPRGRRRRPAPSRWTGRSPPRGSARGACPPSGPRAGRSPPSSRRAARGRPWRAPAARGAWGERRRLRAGAGAPYGRPRRGPASAVKRSEGAGGGAPAGGRSASQGRSRPWGLGWGTGGHAAAVRLVDRVVQ